MDIFVQKPSNLLFLRAVQTIEGFQVFMCCMHSSVSYPGTKFMQSRFVSVAVAAAVSASVVVVAVVAVAVSVAVTVAVAVAIPVAVPVAGTEKKAKCPWLG
jgi:hypothetical protein